MSCNSGRFPSYDKTRRAGKKIGLRTQDKTRFTSHFSREAASHHCIPLITQKVLSCIFLCFQTHCSEQILKLHLNHRLEWETCKSLISSGALVKSQNNVIVSLDSKRSHTKKVKKKKKSRRSKKYKKPLIRKAFTFIPSSNFRYTCHHLALQLKASLCNHCLHDNSCFYVERRWEDLYSFVVVFSGKAIPRGMFCLKGYLKEIFLSVSFVEKSNVWNED